MSGGLYLGYDNPRKLGGYAQGGTIAAPIFKGFAEKAYKGLPVEPFRAPPGIRMVRIDRRRGKPVFGAWPSDDPLSPVVWEASKPEREPRRALQRDETEAEKHPEHAPANPPHARTSFHSKGRTPGTGLPR